MLKFEIIANQALEAPLKEIMPVRDGKPCFTMLKQVDGVGYSGWCMGNEVWPEENVMFILYIEEEKIEVIKERIRELRRKFPLLGLAAYEHSGIIEV